MQDESLASPPDQAALPAAQPQRKQWHVGALTYTSAGLVVLFCWLLWGDFAWSMKDRAISPIMPLLLDKHGVTPKMVGILLVTLPSAIGLFFGPIVSFRSDRMRTRLGRRIPILMLTTPIAALAIVGLAFSPTISGLFVGPQTSAARTTWFLIFFGLFWTTFEFATIAANSVFGALINDVVPTPLLGRFYGLFRALSLLAGIIFNYWLMGKAEAHYLWILTGFAALYGIGFTLMCCKIKEGQYPPPPTTARPGFFSSAKAYFAESFRLPYYWLVFATLMVAGLCFQPVNIFSVQFARALGMDMDFYGKLIATSYAISLCLAFFLGWLADRFHPLRVGIAAMTLYTLCTAWGSMYATSPRMMGIALVAHTVLSGTYFTLTASLPQRLFPRMKFAQFASAAGIISALANMVLGPAFGQVIELTGMRYRYTYTMGCGLSILATLLLLGVYFGARKHGGLASYVAPE